MGKKITVILLTFFIFLFIVPAIPTYSFDCTLEDIQNNSGNSSAIQEITQICTQRANDAHNQANTLSSQIAYMDSQINLTILQITQTENQIVQIQKEIELLTTRIEGLDGSLTYLSRLLITHVVDVYENHNVSFFDILLGSNNADDLINQAKYLKTTQDNNQRLVVQVQEAKLNFEEQKQLRQQKEEELKNLQTKLEAQKVNLNTQQQAEKTLLVETQNSEVNYQNLLEKAREELAGFSAFTNAAGGGLTTFGNGSNGWYFTQRDPAWGNMTLPGSSYNVMTAGCAVTSVAMVCKSYGQNITPASIAGNSNDFIGGDLWNWAFSCAGKSTDWLGTSEDSVKNYVNNNTPVILRLSVGSVSGLHFVVAYAWDSGKNDFKIHDPYYGPDKYFNDRYNWGEVTNAIAIH